VRYWKIDSEIFNLFPLPGNFLFQMAFVSMCCSNVKVTAETGLKCTCIYIHPSLNSCRSEVGRLGPAGGMTWDWSELFSSRSYVNIYYYMAFQNSLFWLVDKRSVKTHIRTVVRIFRIWTGVPDVVYLAENFCFANRKKFCFLNFQLCFTEKNFKQPNCFWLSMHAYRILLPSETDDSRV
jgi:hypothetical protein